MIKLSKPLLIFFIILAIGLAITATQRLSLKEIDQDKTITNNYPTSTHDENTNTSLGQLSASSIPVLNDSKTESSKIPSEYTEVPLSSLERLSGSYYKYRFTGGQKRTEGPDYQNNYTIVFPETWKLYSYTNEKNRDDHGTNILLQKGSDSIVIDQQLYETPTCSLGADLAVPYPCEIKQSIKNNYGNLQVFVPKRPTSLDLKKRWYGVCDKEDEDECSTWSKFGEIRLYTEGNETSENYKEFISIVQSLELIK